MSDWPLVSLSSLLAQHEPEQVVPGPDDVVRFAGVRWYGAGLFVREERKGVEVKGKCYALKPGTLVYNRLFAWKQSFAAVGSDFDGVVVSNEFPQFVVDSELATPEYLALYCSSPMFGEEAFALSTGATAVSRNRLKEEDFMRMRVSRPPVPVQRRIVEVMTAVDEYINTLEAEESALVVLLAAMRQSMLSESPRVPLASVCEIKSKLVDPRDEDYADLIHIGVDSIEKGTGRIVGARTAREDAMISGKYLVGEDDVVYAKIRPALRKAAFPGYVALCSADAYPLSPLNGTPPELLREALLEDGFTAQTTALSTRLKMPKVNRKELFSTTVAMPPSDEDRLNVVKRLGAVRAQLEASSAELARVRTARAALLGALLTRNIEVSLCEGDEYRADATETRI
ncbi:hypothetical protein BMH32_10220 [Leucobacter sp. OLJS4]|uniref:restriction endonuclease subunit S n=1 Tax=unclassified Leucobacter TaxID=2621730 RepID=UPI000C1817E1|nr:MULTISPECIES: restriction endonuclease subunit S [unclassified Leucobacter]PIJ47885.1 hypothetical protein BMH30_06355 [Leucobacter sp. OLES1]PII83004.1 hypothetical protein BMH25_09830 [Leucobacter sp. OLCALW19]PII91668.1 hypothetical protein BMH26_03225 [Leucobacter sp. OLTLW20]PII91746.1 hypothetical protein BMH27_06335 [Leucobacter sp. OLAS13]PII97609.1 hypothetical protein BMH28_13890 [Leucobacter sp. OLCS4]